MFELFQSILDGLRMPAKRSLSDVSFKFKCLKKMTQSSTYRAMKLLENGMMMVERCWNKEYVK